MKNNSDDAARFVRVDHQHSPIWWLYPISINFDSILNRFRILSLSQPAHQCARATRFLCCRRLLFARYIRIVNIVHIYIMKVDSTTQSRRTQMVPSSIGPNRFQVVEGSPTRARHRPERVSAHHENNDPRHRPPTRIPSIAPRIPVAPPRHSGRMPARTIGPKRVRTKKADPGTGSAW